MQVDKAKPTRPKPGAARPGAKPGSKRKRINLAGPYSFKCFICFLQPPSQFLVIGQ